MRTREEIEAAAGYHESGATDRFLEVLLDIRELLQKRAHPLIPVENVAYRDHMGGVGSIYVNCRCGARYMRKRGACPECGRSATVSES